MWLRRRLRCHPHGPVDYNRCDHHPSGGGAPSAGTRLQERAAPPARARGRRNHRCKRTDPGQEAGRAAVRALGEGLRCPSPTTCRPPPPLGVSPPQGLCTCSPYNQNSPPQVFTAPSRPHPPSLCQKGSPGPWAEPAGPHCHHTEPALFNGLVCFPAISPLEWKLPAAAQGVPGPSRYIPSAQHGAGAWGALRTLLDNKHS